MPLPRPTGLLVAGNISFDIVLRPVERFEWHTSQWLDDYLETMGGNGANTSYSAALHGARARLLGMVGSDRQGELLLERLAGAGVDLSSVRRSAAPTTTTVCIVNAAGDRLFLQRLGSSSEAFADPVAFGAELVAGISHFHVGNLFALPRLLPHLAATLEAARTAGLTTSVDTGWDPQNRWSEALAPCLPAADLVFVNEEEGRMLTGQTEAQRIASHLRQGGAGAVVVKLGERGCLLSFDGEQVQSPAFRVAAVDTTGAGDCFAGAFLAALGRGEAPAEAARMANAVGAMCVAELGASCGVRSLALTREWAARREGPAEAAC